jgi:hypothetical protein
MRAAKIASEHRRAEAVRQGDAPENMATTIKEGKTPHPVT